MPHMKRFRNLSLLCPLALSLTALMMACRDQGYVTTRGVVWNTTYNITYDGDTALEDSILKVIGEIGKSLNVFDSCSLVSAVNRSDSAFTVDSHFMAVYETSRRINTASDGMFDPTLSPLIKAWGFGPGHEENRDTLAVYSILSFTGISKTRLEGATLLKDDPRTEFNFSAIAKGYACDAVGAMFRRNGVEDYLVEIGGELAAGGKSPTGGKWRISIDAPVKNDREIVHDSYIIIEVTDAGIATSGNYRNFRQTGGKTIGHTLSPKTGRPVETDVVSATIIAPTAMEADAAATACMAGGSTLAKAMLAELRFQALLILSDSTSWTTPSFPLSK